MITPEEFAGLIGDLAQFYQATDNGLKIKMVSDFIDSANSAQLKRGLQLAMRVSNSRYSEIQIAGLSNQISATGLFGN